MLVGRTRTLFSRVAAVQGTVRVGVVIALKKFGFVLPKTTRSPTARTLPARSSSTPLMNGEIFPTYLER